MRQLYRCTAILRNGLFHVSADGDDAGGDTRRSGASDPEEERPAVLETVVRYKLCFPHSDTGYVTTTCKKNKKRLRESYLAKIFICKQSSFP